jgi:hypothetical protein
MACGLHADLSRSWIMICVGRYPPQIQEARDVAEAA